MPSLLLKQQYNTADDIPKSATTAQKSIYGKVIKVVDGDTIRVRHLPFYPFLTKSSANYQGLLSENTISVRIYGVDAPEMGKFGNPTMFMAQESKEYTEQLVQDKTVKVKLLRKDQYGRIVGKVSVRRTIPFLPRKDVSLELAKKGLATLYTGGGAVYDGNKEALQSAIETAKKRKQGVFSNGASNIMTPAQYKQQIKTNNHNNKNNNRQMVGAAVVY